MIISPVVLPVVAPNEKDKFTGELKIVNSENPDDYEIIHVTLSTHRNRAINTIPKLPTKSPKSVPNTTKNIVVVAAIKDYNKKPISSLL